MASEVLCYNKGCGKKFGKETNNSEACVYHPGVPVFHDALKGWSCCKRRTTDFSDFLNIPGCTKGAHNPNKPAEPVAPKVTSSRPKDESDSTIVEKFTQSAPKCLDTVYSAPRPSVSEPLVCLPVKTTPSLQAALTKLSIQQQAENEETTKAARPRVCRNKACGKTYSEGISETCTYHSGVPIFHEGMKYWSCCKRKTSDFTAFMSQEGCTKGDHDWRLKPLVETAPCRYDWHQTGSVVVLSIFAKMAVAENSTFKVNPVYADVDIEFEGGKRSFQLELELDGVIDPKRSFVTLFGTKVEITLKKADARHWKQLDIPKVVADQPEAGESDKTVPEKDPQENVECVQESGDDDGSDLSGIDDVEFD